MMAFAMAKARPTTSGRGGTPGPSTSRDADVLRRHQVSHALRDSTRVQRLCAECEEEEQGLRRQASGADGEIPNVTPEMDTRIRGLAAGGQPLPDSERQFFEPRFGRDLGAVRLHSGARANELARNVQARAFTLGDTIVLGAGEHAPGTEAGRRLLAHELTHVVQQTNPDGSEKTLQRTPAAPTSAAGTSAPFDRSKVDIFPILDVRTDTPLGQLMAIAKMAFVTFNDPAIVSFVSILHDPADAPISGPTSNAIPPGRLSAFSLFGIPVTGLKQGRHTLRCIGQNAAGEPVAYADRTFWVWTSAPTGKPPDIAALEAEKTTLEATTKAGSGKSIGEVGSAFTKLKDVTHDLSVLSTGTGKYVGKQCAVQPAGTLHTDCTDIVIEVLRDTFAQQGRAADWAKIQKKYGENIVARGGTGVSGLDIQAALQSEAGWKGIYWAPDPKYQVPTAELSGARSDEAGFTATIAKRTGMYMKDFGKKGYPGVRVDQMVTNYAPEAPNVGHGAASGTVKDTTQLDKLKKLPFGVLSTHGGFHMTLITYGKVIEVHWDLEATNVDVIQQTDLARWAVGPVSGFHYYASGVIVAPAADVDAAFK